MNFRLSALTGVVALTVALPLAVASAGYVDGEDLDAHVSDETVRTSESTARTLAAHTTGDAPVSGPADVKAPVPRPTPSRSPLALDLGLATAARCGPELASPDGIEAQTCVLTRGRYTWARTYYRNTTGDDLTSVLTLMGPADRTVRMHCAVGEDDEPGACDTPRERTAGDAREYAAVAEFAEGSDGPLLLRSGSNSPAQTAS